MAEAVVMEGKTYTLYLKQTRGKTLDCTVQAL